MKKITITFLTACLLLTFSPLQSIASVITPISASTGIPPTPDASTALVNRLNEINAMDKSTLSHREKKALRKEVRSIKRNLKGENGRAVGGGVYISAGALLVIIILLIILL